MPKKPVKIILKFSNDSTTSKDKKGEGKGKGGGPNSNDSQRGARGPKKLRP